MGLATLEASKGNVVMNVSDEDGIKVCGLLFDAGEKESTTLLLVGDKKQKYLMQTIPFLLVMCTLELVVERTQARLKTA